MTTPVLVASLKIGMFVAELDRPWSETPFLTEGFLIVEADQLELLRTYCRRVFIDPLRSSPESLSHLGDLRGKQKDAGWDGDHAFEQALSRIFSEWKKKHLINSVLTGKMARAAHFIEQRVLATLGQAKKRRTGAARSRAVPSKLALFKYRNSRGARGEMRRARPLYLHTERLLENASEMLKSNLAIDLKPIDQAARELAQSVIANPQPLMWLSWIRALGLNPTDHAMKVAIQLLAFGRYLGLELDELRKLAMIGLMLDVGKAKVDAVLLQKREALSADELTQVRKHVEFGLEVIGEPSVIGKDIFEGIAQHHERLDGSGYPKGLKDADIGLYGRMAGIVDTFATLTARRAYAPAMSAFDALKVLYAGTDSGFSRDLVEVFIGALGIYPVGSLVELSSGEIAVVLYQTPAHQLRPRVLVLTDAEKLPRRSLQIDLLLNPKERNDHVMRITRGLPLGAYGLDPRRFQLG
jgi:HD-GYP domain-containing protein (c-di-GMP phosphodiesterase class II)